MKKKFILQVVAWLLTVAMLLPSASAALTTAYADEGKVAYESSVTFSDSTYWTNREIGRDALIGDVDPAEIAYIEFTGTTDFYIGYNSASNNDSYWQAESAVSKWVADDINLDWSLYYLQIMLSKGDGVNYTVSWKVVTGDVEAPKEEEKVPEVVTGTVGYSSSVTFSDSTWWTEYELSPSQILGTVDADNVAAVNFSSTTTYSLGYNTTQEGNWVQEAAATSHSTTNMWFGDGSCIKLALSKGNGVSYTISWDVITKTPATPTPTPSPSPTPTPTPVPKYTEVGETLTVTADMVKDGVATIKNAQYKEIIVPRNLGISTITFRVVDVEKLVIEGGENYTVNLRNALVGSVEVTAPSLDEITYDELVDMLAVAEDITAVLDRFRASLVEKSAAAEAQVKLVAKDSEIGELDVKANARIDVTNAAVGGIAVSTEKSIRRMEVKVIGYNGDVSVDLSKGDRVNNAPLSLNFKNSEVQNITVSGEESCHIDGSKSSVATMTVSDINYVATNLDADTLVVDDQTNDATVRVYADVNNLVVAGTNNDIVLPVCANIESAVVSGDDICIYGLGTLENAEITGTGANVATLGTTVEGTNDSSIPQAMIDMMPTATPTPVATPIPLEGAAYAGSGEYLCDSWWSQYSMSKSDLVGNVNTNDILYITFTSTSDCKIGYNPIGDSDWATTDTGKNITILASDVEYFESFNIILTSNSGKNETLVWRVYTEGEVPVEPEKQLYTAIVSGENEWSKTSISKALLLGEYTYDEVESFTFSSEHTFQIGYNCTQTGEWTQTDDVAEPITVPITDVTWDDNAYYFQVALWAASGNEYVITWTVNLKSAEETPTPEATATPTPEATPTPGESDSEEYEIFLAIGAESEGGAWDMCWANEPGNDSGIVATTAMISVGETVTIELEMPYTVMYTYYNVPVLVAGPNVKTLDYTIESVQFDGEEYLDIIDFSAGDAWWYEDIGTYPEGETIRLAGGYNEWGTKYLPGSVAGYKTMTYVITLNDIVYAEPGESTSTVVETDVLIGSGYPGQYGAGNGVPASVFSQYEDEITFTVEYEVTGTNQYPWFAMVDMDNSWAKIDTPLKNEYDVNSVDANGSSVTFTMNVADIPETTIGFQVDGITITKVTLSGLGTENKDAAYVGDWNVGHKISASEIADFGGSRIAVTFKARQLKDRTYTEHKVALTEMAGTYPDVSGWLSLNNKADELTLTIDPETVDAIIASGSNIGIKVYGVIVEDIVKIDVMDEPTLIPRPWADTTAALVELTYSVTEEGNQCANLTYADGTTEYHELFFDESEQKYWVSYIVFMPNGDDLGGDYSIILMPTEAPEVVPAITPGPAYADTVTMAACDNYWGTTEFALTDFYGEIAAENVKSIVLYSDYSIGYQYWNSTEENVQEFGKTYYLIDAEAIDGDTITIILNAKTTAETTIYYELYTEQLVAGYEGSVELVGVANDSWNAAETPITSTTDFFGSVDPSAVEYIVFECPTSMFVQYRAPESQYPGVWGKTLVRLDMSEIEFDYDNFYVKLGLNVCDAVTDTISWKVYTK